MTDCHNVIMSCQACHTTHRHMTICHILQNPFSANHSAKYIHFNMTRIQDGTIFEIKIVETKTTEKWQQQLKLKNSSLSVKNPLL